MSGSLNRVINTSSGQSFYFSEFQASFALKRLIHVHMAIVGLWSHDPNLHLHDSPGVEALAIIASVRNE